MATTGSKKTLFLLSHEFHPIKGGIATFAEEMSAAAAALGHDVEVWAPCPSDPKTGPSGVTIRQLQGKGTQNWSCVRRTRREILRSQHALESGIVHLAEPGPVRAMMFLHFFDRPLPGRIFLTFHGSDVLNLSSSIFGRIFLRRLLAKAERIHTLSRYVSGLLHARFPFVRKKTVVIPGAVRTSLMDRAAQRRHSAEAGEKAVILSVGRIHPRKGQHLLLEAVGRLPGTLQKHVRCRFVGPEIRSSYAARLRRHAESLPVPVDWVGAVDEEALSDEYAAADIFAFTSLPWSRSVEGFGLAVLEAAAHGLPCLAHDHGGIPEVVLDGDTGFLSTPGDALALTANLSRLLNDRNLRSTMGEQARRWAAGFSWKRSALELYGHSDP